jgi:hypothetical protein
MLRIMLPVPLASLLPQREKTTIAARHSLSLEANSWCEAAAEMRRRFPALAERVLSDDDFIRNGFLLVINDEVALRGSYPHVTPGDELTLIAQIAGG